MVSYMELIFHVYWQIKLEVD